MSAPESKAYVFSINNGMVGSVTALGNLLSVRNDPIEDFRAFTLPGDVSAMGRALEAVVLGIVNLHECPACFYRKHTDDCTIGSALSAVEKVTIR
jgi:hypothetical protein